MSDFNMFRVGPEDLEFMGQTSPIIDATEAIITDHNGGVDAIRARFLGAVKKAQQRAEADYASLCAATAEKLREVRHD